MQERKSTPLFSEPHQRLLPTQQSWNYGENEMKSEISDLKKDFLSPPHYLVRKFT
jgi:hypothetical protein